MKRLIVFMLVISTLFACVACQPTPDKPPVISKNDGQLEKEIYEGASKGWELSVPEAFSCDESLYGDKIKVKAENAKVECAKTSDFSVYEATFHRFTAEEIQSYLSKCFPEGELFLHNAQLTRDEITRIYVVPSQQTLWEMENGEYELFDEAFWNKVGGKPSDMERYKRDTIQNQKKTIEFYKELADAAPETVTRQEVDFSAYNPTDGIDLDIIQKNGQTGRLRVSKQGCVLEISLGDYQIENSTDPRNDSVGVGLYNVLALRDRDISDPDVKTALSHLSLSRYEAKSAAEEFVHTLGHGSTYKAVYTGLAWCAADSHEAFRPVVTEFDFDEIGMKYYYAICFTRDVDGVQVAERNGAWDAIGWDMSDGIHENHSAGYTNEALNVFVNDKGVCGFTFKAPLDVTLVQDNVALIDFDEAAERAVKQVAYKNNGEMQQNAEYDGRELPDSERIEGFENEITNFSLRYAECAVKDDMNRLLLIPIWICYANATVIFRDGSKEDWYVNDTLKPVCGINAIDGSTYSFGLGY